METATGKMKRNTDNEITIDLVELFFELLKHWKSIVLSTILVGAIVGGYTFFRYVPEYRATAELYILGKSITETSLADLQFSQNLSDDYMYVTTGRTVLTRVISNLDLDDTYETLSKRVTVENKDKTHILTIKVVDKDVDQAMAIADEITDVTSEYIADRMDLPQPRVIQKGYAPEIAINNNIVKRTIMGMLIGFLLASGITTLIYIFDDSIDTPYDLESKVDIRVLASVPDIEEDSRRSKKRSNKKHSKKTTMKKVG